MRRVPIPDPLHARRALDEALARMDPPPALRRSIGSPALFGIVHGLIAASVYFALGLVAERALGLTWVTFAAAALFFGLSLMTYVEGASLHRERGGATVFARHAFNELWSFVAGWAILLDYLILVALTAFAATDYLAAFWPAAAAGGAELGVTAVIIAYVALVNISGPTPRRFERTALFVFADLALQVVLVVAGLSLLWHRDLLLDPIGLAGNPETIDVVFAFTLAAVAFSGLDAASGLSGEVAIGRRGLRRLVAAETAAVMVPYVGIALVAIAAFPLHEGLGQGNQNYVDAPVLAILAAFPTEWSWLREVLRYLVAASAVAVLVVACNAAMLGLSRLGYSLATNRQVPSAVGRLHPRRSTPVVLIASAAVLAFALAVPADLEFLAAIYAYGAMLAFTLAHASICVLRYREPHRDRPYRMPFNVRFRGGDLPLPAVLGTALAAAAWLSVVLLHEGARFLGTLWMAGGLTLYVIYRKTEGKPLFRRVTIPERALARVEGPEVAYGSILVPIFGASIDDDIVQTAGRLAGEEDLDEGEGGPVIEALWVFEVPMALPLDARLPEQELKRAREALHRAKAVGEEYVGVEVATATTRARRMGAGIVAEAKRRGVEAIVLAAEEPSRVRGGALLGGRAGPADSHIGEVTRYVLDKAPCRVILTAPPASDRPDSIALAAIRSRANREDGGEGEREDGPAAERPSSGRRAPPGGGRDARSP